VAHQRQRGDPELLDQLADVGQQVAHPVGLDVLRPAGEVVAAHVRRVDGVIPAEVVELPAPEEPELREAVQEENRLALAARDVVHAALGQVGEVVLEFSGGDQA
jgi:hypothetical protein